MSKIPSFESLRAKTIGTNPVFFKVAQAVPPPGGMPPGQGMGGVTIGRPDEMQAPESADETIFENDFSTLAFQFVQDRAPALMPYMLGFEVVDRSNDGSKAVGIYGYKIDDDFYYIPVFFLNNQIRGVDMILNKKTNSFIPITEDWVNYIINKHSVTLGKDVGGDFTSSLEQPDLTFLREPKNQVVSKVASADDEMWSLKTAWHIMKEKSIKMASEDPLLKEMFNGALRAVKGAPFKKCAEAKYINGFMRTVGGPEAQISFLKTFKNIKFANAALTFYENLDAFNEPNVKEAHVHKSIMAKKAAALPKLRIVTAEEQTVEVKDETSLSEEDAKHVLDKGFTIQDARPDEYTADMVDDTITVDFEKRFSTPTEVGKYSFVMDDGKLREGFLLSLTYSASDCNSNDTVIYFPDDNVVAQAPADTVLVDTGTASKANGTSFNELFTSAKSKLDIEPSSDYQSDGYLFIGPDGQAFGPVRIRAVFKDGDDTSYSYRYDGCDLTVKTKSIRKSLDFGSWDISDRFHDSDGYRRNDGVSIGNSCCSYEPCIGENMIRFCSGIHRPTVNTKGVILPDDWKVVKAVNINPYASHSPEDTEESYKAKEDKCEKIKQEYRAKYTFGSPTSILASLQSQGIARVKIASTGLDEFHIHVEGYRQTPRMTYKEAAVALVSRFGVRPTKAFSALCKAADEGSVRVLISSRNSLNKEAQVGVSMPMPTPQEASVDPYTGIPVYQDPYIDKQNGEFTNVPSLPEEGGLTPGIAEGSEIQRNINGPQDAMIPIDQHAQDLAAQAAQAGQKHVFDQAAVGGLSKVYDTSAVVDSFIPNFMDSLDRLGRILFLFYWKHEDFNARYGSDDVVEMEDRLRGVFKQLGDLTLKLKEKAVRED